MALNIYHTLLLPHLSTQFSFPTVLLTIRFRNATQHPSLARRRRGIRWSTLELLVDRFDPQSFEFFYARLFDTSPNVRLAFQSRRNLSPSSFPLGNNVPLALNSATDPYLTVE